VSQKATIYDFIIKNREMQAQNWNDFLNKNWNDFLNSVEKNISKKVYLFRNVGFVNGAVKAQSRYRAWSAL
jgi:hypothetical protein